MGVELTDTLLEAVQDLSQARQVEDVQEIARKAARRLVDADGATFILRDGDHCFYVDEDAISPLWKGQRFPLDTCISGWTILHGSAVSIQDIYEDDRVPHDAYRPTFVKSLVMTPIRSVEPLGAIGMYWADHHRATPQEMAVARSLADSTAVALENVRLQQQLERTRKLAHTDFLTGLANRRVWEQAVQEATQPGAADFCVAIADLDGFKQFNDTHGHLAGDSLLQELAASWRAQLRPEEFIARFGGDEFAILIESSDQAQAARIVDRLRDAAPDGITVSVGLAQWDRVESAHELVERADRALYAAKTAGDDGLVPADSA
jgi:diguanylate cyclase (GGDEF)-like protein